jgi:DNA-binding transcriptional LysR family regulator
MPELSLDDLAIFVRVVEHAGFASAARELGVPTSTVSRTIARLEATTRTRLLHRTTRTVKPTGEGRELYASAADAVTTLRSAARAIEPATRKPKGRVRVAAPNDLCATFLADVLVAFMDRYPLVQLDFVLANQHANLVEEGFDVAIRAAARLGDSSLVARKLGQLELRLYASPGYLAKHGTPASAPELRDHRCVLFRAKELERTWLLHGPKGDESIDVSGRIGGDDFSFVHGIVRAGGGIGVLPHLNASREEENGTLVRVLPELTLRGALLHVLYPSAHNLPARVTVFRDFVVAAYEAWAARRGA